MTSDKFDFQTAMALITALQKASDALDVKNGQMEKKFGELNQFFKDSGYEAYSLDMSAANKVIDDVRTQMWEVTKHIAAYAEKLRDAV